MAGHSQFKNIMHRKGKQDAQKAKIFNRIARDIVLAVRASGEDPNGNPKLRMALVAARGANMPNDRITRAIKTGSGALAGADPEEVRYEGYGPGGIAIIIEALTDNRQRTAPEIRTAMSKHGGTLGETNSVSFQFKRQGEILYPAKIGAADTVFETAAEAGADNVESDTTEHYITTSVESYASVLDALTEKFGTPLQSAIVWEAHNKLPVSGEQATSLVKLLHALEDLDDVQNVFGNFEIDTALMEKMSA
jgi:YebC/PmpR family DNA-binding regulatory protein